MSAAWLAAAKTVAFGLAFVLPLLLVRRLDVAEFGLYKQAFLVVNTAILLLPLGFAMSTFYFWPREPRKRDALVLNVALFYFVTTGAAGVLLAAKPDLLAALFHGPELVAHGRSLGLVVLLWGTSSFLELVAIANGETRLASAFIVALQLTKVVVLAGVALVSPTVGALITAALLQGALQVALAFTYLASRFGRFWERFDGALLRAQLAYALPHGLAAWLYWVHMELHSYVVAHRFDAATYAVYAVGCFELPLVAILWESVGSVAIPEVSRLQKEGRPREIVVLAAELMRKLAAIYLPLYAFLFVVRREFIAVLFTDRYLASVPIFALNLTLIPLAVLAAPGDAVMRAYAECRFFLLKLRTALAAATLVALWLAVGRFGPVGAIAVVVGARLVDRVAVSLKARALLGVGSGDLVLFGDLVRLALAAVAAGLVGAAARQLVAGAAPLVVLGVCGLVVGITYLAAVLASGVPRPGEREAVAHYLFAVGRRRPSADSVA